MLFGSRRKPVFNILFKNGGKDEKNLSIASCACNGICSGCLRTGTPAASSSGEPAAEPTTSDTTPLVVGYSNFNSKFSPFFAESAYDMDVQQMTQVPLLTSDRTGAVIQKGIEGETIEFNGTPYTYYGPADLTITENDDGSV